MSECTEEVHQNEMGRFQIRIPVLTSVDLLTSYSESGLVDIQQRKFDVG